MVRFLLGYPPIKALLPIPIIAAIAPAIWWFFRQTWRELDAEAEAARSEGGLDYRRPAACLIIVAMVLTLRSTTAGAASTTAGSGLGWPS